MNIFQIKTKPNGEDRTREFLGDGKFGRAEIGWGETGDLSNCSKEEIREKLIKEFGYIGQSLNTNLGTVNCFVHTVNDDDLGLIVDGDRVHGGILGPYKFDHKLKLHTRSIEWKFVVYKTDLNQYVRTFVENRTSITKFKHPIEIAELDHYLKETPLLLSTGSFNAKIDTDELVQQSLQILSDEIASGDHGRQVTAAIEILRFLKK